MEGLQLMIDEPGVYDPDITSMVDIIQDCRKLDSQFQSAVSSGLTDYSATMSVNLVTTYAHAIPELLIFTQQSWCNTRLFYQEACCSMLLVYWWYTAYG